VSKAKQIEAVEFLNKQLFRTPSWLINNDVFDKTGINAISTIGGLQDIILNRILSTRTLSKLIDAEAEEGSNAYATIDFLNNLKKGIWSELTGKIRIDVYRRNLQKSYINIMDGLLNPQKNIGSSDMTVIMLGGGSPTSIDKSDIRSVVRAHLSALRNEVRAGSSAVADPMSRYHLQDILVRIDKALNPKD